MSSVPLNTRAPFRFCPLREQIAQAREDLDTAAKDVAEAKAKADADPTNKKLAENLIEAQEWEMETQENLDKLEGELAANPKQPVYLLRVPTYRSNDALVAMSLGLPQSPSDRRMFRAIKQAAETGALPLDDADLLDIEVALKSSGGGVPEEMTGVFQDLFDRVSDHPAVRDVVVARYQANSADRELTIRFHLLGWENVDIDGVPAVFDAKDGLAAESCLDAIPPADCRAIVEKVKEMNRVGSRLGNSSASPSPSLSTPTASPVVSDAPAQPQVDQLAAPVETTPTVETVAG